MRQRNQAVDILKGIGILLVLVAHSLEGFVSQFAYTFHMPLFFIATGLFISIPHPEVPGAFLSAMRKDAVRLLLPAAATTLLILSVYPISVIYNNIAPPPPPHQLIWDSSPALPIDHVRLLGNLWFLFALFFAKQTFYILARHSPPRHLGALCLLTGGLAALAGQHFRLPFQVIQGISVVPFLWVGHWLKQHGGPDQAVPLCGLPCRQDALVRTGRLWLHPHPPTSQTVWGQVRLLPSGVKHTRSGR